MRRVEAFVFLFIFWTLRRTIRQIQVAPKINLNCYFTVPQALCWKLDWLSLTLPSHHDRWQKPTFQRDTHGKQSPVAYLASAG